MAPNALLAETNTNKNSLEARYPLVAEDLARVKTSLLAILKPEAAILAENMQLSLSNTGKLFRPALLLLTAKACGAQHATNADIETAAVAELIHTATLIHDDVLDDAELRRGEPTLKHLQGNKIAILSGDYLLAQASLKLSTLNHCRLVAIYAHVLSDLCDGELLQLQQERDVTVTWDAYLRKTQCKTATLFEACTESAGVIHQQPEAIIEALKAYGRHLGLAFQLADDLLDFTSDSEKLGKPALGDLQHGLLTAPIILALDATKHDSTAHQALTARIEDIFSQESDASSDTAIQALLKTLEEEGYLEKARQLALEHAEHACQSLSVLEDTPYRQALEDLARHAVQRLA
jgi:all-trans-nonaprenyl-diphosphate synthase